MCHEGVLIIKTAFTHPLPEYLHGPCGGLCECVCREVEVQGEVRSRIKRWRLRSLSAGGVLWGTRCLGVGVESGTRSSWVTPPQWSTLRLYWFLVADCPPPPPAIQALGVCTIFSLSPSCFLFGSAVVHDLRGCWRGCFISAWNREDLFLCGNVWVNLSCACGFHLIFSWVEIKLLLSLCLVHWQLFN